MREYVPEEYLEALLSNQASDTGAMGQQWRRLSRAPLLRGQLSCSQEIKGALVIECRTYVRVNGIRNAGDTSTAGAAGTARINHKNRRLISIYVDLLT